MPPCLLTLSLSPLPMSEPSRCQLTVRFVYFSLCPSPWSASVHLPVSCHLSGSRLHRLSLSLHLSLSLSLHLVSLLFVSLLLPSVLGSRCLLGPPPSPPISSLPPVFLPFPPPPGYEKSRSLSSIAGLSGVSLRLAPLATPPGSPRAARRAPPTLPSIL